MKGPFIHRKPLEVVNAEYQKYLCNDNNETIHEERFLSKKYPNEMILFFTLDVPIAAIASLMVCQCGNKSKLIGDLIGRKVKCSKCNSENVISSIDMLAFEKARKDAFSKASNFFERRYEELCVNHQICNRY